MSPVQSSDSTISLGKCDILHQRTDGRQWTLSTNWRSSAAGFGALQGDPTRRRIKITVFASSLPSVCSAVADITTIICPHSLKIVSQSPTPPPPPTPHCPHEPQLDARLADISDCQGDFFSFYGFHYNSFTRTKHSLVILTLSRQLQFGEEETRGLL